MIYLKLFVGVLLLSLIINTMHSAMLGEYHLSPFEAWVGLAFFVVLLKPTVKFCTKLLHRVFWGDV
jgi:hypothetical protein